MTFAARKLLTKVKDNQDATDEDLSRRRAMAQSMTPAQLAQISSVADLPLPATLERFLKAEKKKPVKTVKEKKEAKKVKKAEKGRQ